MYRDNKKTLILISLCRIKKEKKQNSNLIDIPMRVRTFIFDKLKIIFSLLICNETSVICVMFYGDEIDSKKNLRTMRNKFL